MAGKSLGSLHALIAALCCTGPAYAALTVALEPSVPSPVPLGTLVTWTASATNGSGRFWFRFGATTPDGSSRLVKDFGPDPTFDWAPIRQEGVHAVEVWARDLETGEVATAAAQYELLSNVAGAYPSVNPTSHPMVPLYSAPPCPPGASMTVFFQEQDAASAQSTPPLACDGRFSMNTYLAGLRVARTYSVRHVIDGDGIHQEGPALEFVSGEPAISTPDAVVAGPAAPPAPEQVQLFGSVFAPFYATDLSGALIWYYPKSMLFLTQPEPGGYFLGADERPSGDQSQQIIREFDLAGVTLLETNAARVSEQLAALGGRAISGFHHDVRRLSDGKIAALASVEQILTDVQGPGPVDVVGDMIVVLNQNLEVVWTWDAFDHLDVRRMATLSDACSPAACPPVFLASSANDWLHGNSLTETPDGNLLYSSRSQDWAIKIAYRNGSGAGEVMWKLGTDGDFAVQSNDPSPWFSHQHNPHFIDDRLVAVLDNGNGRQFADKTAHSRGQVYRLDEDSRVAELVLNADLGDFSFALGSVDLLSNGNFSFDAGFLADGSSKVVEVDASGQPVFEMHSTAPSYRTFRLNTLYNK